MSKKVEKKFTFNLNINTRTKYLLLFIWFFCIRTIGLVNGAQISLLIDHIGDLAVPAKLAGNDWSYLVSLSSYYGYGFKWLYFVFFKMTDNPYVIYTCIVILHNILQALVLVFFLNKIEKVFPKNTGLLEILAVSMIALSTATSGFNSEGSLFVGMFLLCIIMIPMFENRTRKYRTLSSIALSLYLVYLITIHERCVGIIAAVVIVLALDWIISKKCAVQPAAFLVSLAVFYFAEEKLKDYVISVFWAEKFAEGTLKNTSVSISNPLWFLENRDQFGNIVQILISNLFTLVTRTYGLIILPVALCILGIVFLISKKEVFNNWYQENGKMVCPMMICLLTTLIILGGVAHRWGRNMLNGNYKGMAYHRYYLVFVWPAVIIAVLLWNTISEKVKWFSCWITMGVYGLSTLVFRKYVAEYVAEMNDIDIKRFFYSEYLIPIEINSENRIQLAMQSVCISAVLIFFIMSGNTIIRKLYYLIMVFVVLTVVTTGWNVHFQKVTALEGNVYEYLKEMDEKVGLPQTIYVNAYEGKKSGKQRYNLQFLLNRHSIVSEWPEGEEEALIVSNVEPDNLSAYTDMKPEGYIRIEDDRVLYIVGDDYYELLEESGYTIKEIK